MNPDNCLVFSESHSNMCLKPDSRKAVYLDCVGFLLALFHCCHCNLKQWNTAYNNATTTPCKPAKISVWNRGEMKTWETWESSLSGSHACLLDKPQLNLCFLHSVIWFCSHTHFINSSFLHSVFSPWLFLYMLLIKSLVEHLTTLLEKNYSKRQNTCELFSMLDYMTVITEVQPISRCQWL